MASCDDCKKIVSATLEALLIVQKIDSCIGLGAAFEAECILIGGGPEDPIADAICSVVAVAITTLCIEYGIEHMKDHIPEMAAIICKELGFCVNGI